MENVTINSEIIPTINSNNEIVIDDTLTIINCYTDDNNNIWGYRSDNNQKAKYSIKHNKWFYGKNIGTSNLIDLSDRTESEKMEIIQKSRIKAKENREKQRHLMT